GAAAGEADLSALRQEDVRRVGAGQDQRPLAEGKRMAADQAPRQVGEAERRRHGSGAPIDHLQPRRRRDRRREHLAKRSKGDVRQESADSGQSSGCRTAGYEEARFAIESISWSAFSRSFRSESKL